jgi:hypothetical protein
VPRARGLLRRPPGKASGLLAAFCFVARTALPQEPPVLVPENADFSGTWKGTAKFTNEWASPVCTFEGSDKAQAPAVTLEVTPQTGEGTSGVVTLEVRPSAGPCPTLKKRYELPDIKVVGSRLAFVDAGGASWDLALHAGTLVGIVNWRPGPLDEPLAEGFHAPDGSTPMTRLSGEVRLKREGPQGTPSGPTGKTTAKGTLFGLGNIIVANLVAAGVLLEVHNLSKGGTGGQGSQSNCSPRSCTIGGVAGACLCNDQIAQGGSCASSLNGLGGTIGAACFVTTPNPLPADTPCANGLSCNNGVCQDFQTGQCPPPT